MEVRLVAIHGPLKGMSFSLEENETSIGRGSDNTISINDRKLSRRHCVIRRESDQFELRDLDSRNGTRVNGIPRAERLLEAGDLISFSDSVFLFDWVGATDGPQRGRVLPEEAPTLTESLVRITQEEALRIQRDGLELHDLPAERLSRELNTLLKINSLLGSVRGLEPLQARLLELIFQNFPVERGGIVYGEDSGSEYQLISHGGGAKNEREEFRPSRTILEAVLKEGTPILSNHILQDPALAGAPSLIESGVHSVLCVPLRSLERNLGAIYLENRTPALRFDEHHLRLLTAIAGAAAAGFENASHVEWLTSEHQRLEADLALDHNMLGRSPAIQKVFELIARVAPTDSTVLITGESGTGKELAARAIHQNSSRAGKPFLAVNCATLTDTLLENELFGHEKGAFTGAIGQKKGKLEVADGGTVLLDEVGELAPELQAKLLRFLQEREFERVGGHQPIRVDVRILASTNRNLEQAIGESRFRQDLYYRLNVVSLKLPPLRLRSGDVILLSEHFLNRFGRKCDRPLKGFAPQARRYLENYQWPGNVRELQNAIERAVVMSSGSFIVPDDLPEGVLDAAAPAAQSTKFHDQITQRKRELIVNALESAGGNFTEAAKSLGIHRTYLHRLIRNLGLADKLKS